MSKDAHIPYVDPEEEGIFGGRELNWPTAITLFVGLGILTTIYEIKYLLTESKLRQKLLQ